MVGMVNKNFSCMQLWLVEVYKKQQNDFFFFFSMFGATHGRWSRLLCQHFSCI